MELVLTLHVLVVQNVSDNLLLFDIVRNILKNSVEHFGHFVLAHDIFWRPVLELLIKLLLIFVVNSRSHVVYLVLHELSAPVQKSTLYQVVPVFQLSILLLIGQAILHYLSVSS